MKGFQIKLPLRYRQLLEILNYVDQLKDLQDEAAGLSEVLPGTNLTREDIAIKLDDPADVLKQAPGLEGDFVKVKSVLE